MRPTIFDALLVLPLFLHQLPKSFEGMAVNICYYVFILVVLVGLTLRQTLHSEIVSSTSQGHGNDYEEIFRRTINSRESGTKLNTKAPNPAAFIGGRRVF